MQIHSAYLHYRAFVEQVKQFLEQIPHKHCQRRFCRRLKSRKKQYFQSQPKTAVFGKDNFDP